MTVLAEASAPYLKPLPQVTEANREFFEGLKRREFLVPKCGQCGDYNWVPYPACRSCLSEDQTWTRVSGEATVYSYSVIYRGPGAFDADVPYVVVLGELTERPRPCLVLGNLVGTDPDEIRVGMPVQIAYQDIPGEDITLWRWVAR
ncbi:MAG TPA: OB-fold domain-containing protein [Streptosporangiaceae bacterium]|nr:OB-fold domain-containing protein [Streptosporangiaceae bacterium]